LVPLGDTDTGVARHRLGILEAALLHPGCDIVSAVVAGGVNDAGEVRSHAEHLAGA
jgi:hypothetical protein